MLIHCCSLFRFSDHLLQRQPFNTLSAKVNLSHSELWCTASYLRTGLTSEWTPAVKCSIVYSCVIEPPPLRFILFDRFFKTEIFMWGEDFTTTYLKGLICGSKNLEWSWNTMYQQYNMCVRSMCNCVLYKPIAFLK